MKHSPETIERISAASSRPKSPEHIEAVRKALTGLRRSEEIKQRFRGKPKSPETRAKISAGLAGHVRTPESREKQSRAMKGRPKSPETRAKMAAAAKERESRKRNGNPASYPRESRLTAPRA